MKPNQVSQYLREIAAAIELSSRLELVPDILSAIAASLIEQEQRYFAFPTRTDMLGPLDDPQYLTEVLDRIKDDFSLARIYGDVVGTYQDDDFYWVIGIDPYDEELAEEINEMDIAVEIPKAKLAPLPEGRPEDIWMSQFGVHKGL